MRKPTRGRRNEGSEKDRRFTRYRGKAHDPQRVIQQNSIRPSLRSQGSSLRTLLSKPLTAEHAEKSQSPRRNTGRMVGTDIWREKKLENCGFICERVSLRSQRCSLRTLRSKAFNRRAREKSQSPKKDLLPQLRSALATPSQSWPSRAIAWQDSNAVFRTCSSANLSSPRS